MRVQLLFVRAAHSRSQLVQVGGATVTGSAALVERAPEINRKSGLGHQCLIVQPAVEAAESRDPAVKVIGVAPLRCRRHPAHQLREAPFDPVSQLGAKRQRRSAKEA